MSVRQFERLHIGNSCSHIWCISTQYESSSYMKVIGSRSRSRTDKSLQQVFMQRMPACRDKSAYAHVKTHRQLVYNTERWSVHASYDFHLWPIKWHDRHLSTSLE